MTFRPTSRRRCLPGQRHCLLEGLETRQLFAVIPVTSHGATPNDGSDDTAAIQRAINASSPGDTILFSGGAFDIKGVLKDLPGSRTYRGEGGAMLRGRTPSGQLLNVRTDNVTITGLTLAGGGIFLDRPGGGFNRNIVIDNNVFRLDTSGQHRNAIEFTSGLADSRVTNNLFTGYNGVFGMYGYNYNNLVIANNEFIDINAGMHIDAFVNSGNLLVEQNYLRGIKGMGLEFQSRANNLKFYDNWYEKPNLSTDRNRNHNAFAFSLILDKSSTIEIKRNVVIAPERPDGIGTRIAFEVGGDNAIVEDNYVNGVNHVLAMNDGVGSASVTVRNNRFMNYRQGASASFLNGERRWTNTNNGPNVQLTWDINRGTPGRNRRFGAPLPPVTNQQPPNNSVPSNTQQSSNPTTTPAPTPAPASTPTPAPAPAPAPVVPAQPTKPTNPTLSTPVPIAPTPIVPVLAAPTNYSAVALSYNRVNLLWKDKSVLEKGYRVERSLDGKTWSQVASLAANSSRFVDNSAPVGTRLFYRVVVEMPNGSTKSTVALEVTTPDAVSTSPVPVTQPTNPMTAPVPVQIGRGVPVYSIPVQPGTTGTTMIVSR